MSRAADVIKMARERAGLTQTQLARAAGVTQSVISAYETGRREPGVGVLEKLVRASGQELVIDVVPAVAPVADAPADGHTLALTALGLRLLERRQAVLERARAAGVTNVRVFGSVARGQDGPHSDVDLLVDLAPGTGLFALLALQRELGEVLGASVDVVPSTALKERYRDAVLADARAL